MRVKVTMPDGTERLLPDYATCYCCVRHTPKYFHPLPFGLPDGTELWLCPTTHHAVHSLLKIYRKVQGVPNYKTEITFTYFVRSLAKEYWHQLRQLEDDRQVQDERMAEYEKEMAADEAQQAFVQKIKEKYS